jgi:hypothetical protein
MRCYCVLLGLYLVGCAPALSVAQASRGVEDYGHWSDKDWREPPKQVRPMLRWWWPGGDVTKAGISSELALIDSLGFGGVEIQPFTIGLPDNSGRVTAVRSVGTPQFVANVRFAIAQTHARGLRADLTISSGWGVGLATDCADCGTYQLLMTEFDVTGPADIDRALLRPTTTPYQTQFIANRLGLVGNFDSNLELVAALRGRLRGTMAAAGDSTSVLDDLSDVTSSVRDGRLRAAVPQGRFRVFAVYRNLTNTRLAGAAYPGDVGRFRTVDHLDARGLSAFLRGYFDPLTKRLGAPPDHYFVDSFEFLTDVPWTRSFRDAFAKARGYDIVGYLPLLFSRRGEYSFQGRTPPRAVIDGVSERVWEDYVDVRAQLFETKFIAPLRNAVLASGSRLRLQALGGYGDYIDVFAHADVPEAEDFGLAGASEFLRLASSAAHIAGRRWASNESFVTQAPTSTSLTEDDYHRMAGRAAAAGLNQIVVHGRAYPVTGAGTLWYPFEWANITTRIDSTNPVWPRLPHLNATFARMTYAMSRGRAGTSVAWLLTDLRPPEFDRVEPPDAVPFRPYRELSAVTRQLRQHAVGYDRVSRSALVKSARVCGQRVCIGDGRYSMILVDEAAVASVDWLKRLRELAAAGIPIVFVGSEATRARGFAEAAARDRAVRDVMAELAQMPAYRRVPRAEDLGQVLTDLTEDRSIRPMNPSAWQFATYERILPSEDLMLIFNGTDTAQVAAFDVLGDVRQLVVLDPENGTAGSNLDHRANEPVHISIPAGRSRIVRLLRNSEGSD